MEIKLNGPTALIGLVAVVAFAGYRMTTMKTELETEALEELKAYLVAEYQSGDIAALSAKLESNELSHEEALARTEAIVDAQDITFESVSARGMWKGRDGDDVIVKVDIRVSGGPPPDGEPVRYYRMRYRGLAGWKVGARTSVWSYRLKLF